MSDPGQAPTPPAPTENRRPTCGEKVICERGGVGMFRRCLACRYKTDCCGW